MRDSRSTLAVLGLVAAVCLLAATVAILFVLPHWAEEYYRMSLPLPPTLQALLQLSAWIGSGAWMLVLPLELGLIGLAILFLVRTRDRTAKPPPQVEVRR